MSTAGAEHDEPPHNLGLPMRSRLQSAANSTVDPGLRSMEGQASRTWGPEDKAHPPSASRPRIPQGPAPSVSVNVRYAAGSSRASISDASDGPRMIIQPSPYGSRLTTSGESARC